MPFGEETMPVGGDLRNSGCYATELGVRQKFTGKERDAESGLDYFGARYLSSAQGRWTSPDWSPTPQAVPYADLTDPQTLNLYSYVRNNPLSRADADGHCFWDACIAEATAVVAGVGATAAYLASPAGQRAIAATVALVNKTATAIGHGLDVLNSAPSACGVSCTSEFYPGPGANTGLTFSQSNQDGPKDVYIDPNKYPAAAGHAADAQAAGQPEVITVDRKGASGRRRQATAGQPTQAGSDRDEYPPAVAAEGGRDSSVRSIPSGDNRGAGASVGRQIRNVPNGGTIRIIPKPKPENQQP
jgi:RHS repeat-associated protein